MSNRGSQGNNQGGRGGNQGGSQGNNQGGRGGNKGGRGGNQEEQSSERGFASPNYDQKTAEKARKKGGENSRGGRGNDEDNE